MTTYTVVWQGGHAGGLSEGESERLQRTLIREFGMVVSRHVEANSQHHPTPPDELLISQVREQVAAGAASPVRNPEGRGNAA